MEPSTIVLAGLALVVGLLIGWLAARPTAARLEAQLEQERAAHAAQRQTWQQAEDSFRDAFASLSAQALSRNSEAFLQLAETRLKQARVEAAADVDARKQAIEDLLAADLDPAKLLQATRPPGAPGPGAGPGAGGTSRRCEGSCHSPVEGIHHALAARACSRAQSAGSSTSQSAGSSTQRAPAAASCARVCASTCGVLQATPSNTCGNGRRRPSST